ncbi:MAG TPA: MBL fold metallo-hydrolase [Selenomonadales bacterium]|nr:MBL fold metallo-hydrolase [Selenomonadales bacterium]
MYLMETVGSRGVLFSTDTIPDCATNIYLIKGKRYNFVIDTGLGEDTAGYVMAYIKANCPKPVLVFNTHHHWDHIWGNSVFEGCDIYAHRLTCGLIEQKWAEMERRCGKWREGPVRKVLPTKLVENDIYFPDEAVGVFPSPGHTCDSISIYDGADGILHVGDNIETLMPELYDTKDRYLESLAKYLTYDFTRCVGGHNGRITREEVEQVMALAQAEA